MVLLADLLPLVNRFPDKPLMYNIAWKTAIYVIAALIIHYLEHLIPRLWQTRSFDAANDLMLKEIIWPHFWVIQLWLLILLFAYCTMRELVRALGPQEVRRIFFGHPAKLGS